MTEARFHFTNVNYELEVTACSDGSVLLCAFNNHVGRGTHTRLDADQIPALIKTLSDIYVMGGDDACA